MSQLQNSPIVRLVLYILAIVAQIVAWFVGDLGVSWTGAMDHTAKLLAALGGLTSIANLSTTPKAIQPIAWTRRRFTRRRRPVRV